MLTRRMTLVIFYMDSTKYVSILLDPIALATIAKIKKGLKMKKKSIFYNQLMCDIS